MGIKYRIETAACIASLALAAGCLVGPDFERPETADLPSKWLGVAAANGDTSTDTSPAAASAAGASSTNWWATFGDPVLDGLLARGREENLTLRQALVRIGESRASLRQSTAALLPSASASAGASDSKQWNPSDTREAYNAGIDASWEADLMGGARRAREAAIAELEATEYAYAASLLEVEAEIAARYFDLRLQQADLETTRSNAVLQSQSAQIARARSEAGVASDLDRLSTEAQLHSTEAQIPSLEAAVDADIRSLELLLGLMPGALAEELSAAAPVPSPAELPALGVPAEALERRPDVRQSEARLHAATAQVGVALADRFPNVKIGGSASISTDSISSWGDALRSLGANAGVSLPLFDFGARRARHEQRKLELEEAAVAYRGTVLSALSEVETAWRSLEREQAKTETLGKAAEETREAASLALRLYDAGQADYQEVISRHAALLSAEQALNRHRAQMSSSAVALYKALAGGY